MNDEEIRKQLSYYQNNSHLIVEALLNLNETLKNFALMYIAHVNDENIKLDRCIYDLERIIEEGMKTR